MATNTNSSTTSSTNNAKTSNTSTNNQTTASKSTVQSNTNTTDAKTAKTNSASDSKATDNKANTAKASSDNKTASTKATASDKSSDAKTNGADKSSQVKTNGNTAKAKEASNQDAANAKVNEGQGTLGEVEKQLTPREERLMELKKHGIDMEKLMEVQKTPEIEQLMQLKHVDHKSVGKMLKQGNLGTILEFGKKFKETEKVAKDLGDYIYSIGGVNNPEEYVRATYGVYLSISTVLKEKDFSKFNLKFRYLIGIICNAKKEAKADELTFLKHDTSWKWGGTEFKKFHSLITAIYAACDKGIKNVGSVVDLEKVVADLPAEAKANVKAFFTK